MKKALLLSLLFCFSLTSFAVAAAPKLTFATKSVYRQIDKAGASVPADLKKFVNPKVGVGNIVFSAGQLPFGKEDSYQVGTAFNFADVEKNLQARAYYPAKREDIIAYVKSVKPNFEFSNQYGHVKWKTPDEDISYAQLAGNPTWPLSEDSLTWDQEKLFIFPTKANFKDSIMQSFFENSAPDKPGTHNISVAIYLRFTTGEYKQVSRWEGDQLITENVPYYWDYLISYGDVNIEVPKK